jgi:hypothetical protein
MSDIFLGCSQTWYSSHQARGDFEREESLQDRVMSGRGRKRRMLRKHRQVLVKTTFRLLPNPFFLIVKPIQIHHKCMIDSPNPESNIDFGLAITMQLQSGLSNPSIEFSYTLTTSLFHIMDGLFTINVKL